MVVFNSPDFFLGLAGEKQSVGGGGGWSWDVTRTVWCSTPRPRTHTYTGFLTQSKLFLHSSETQEMPFTLWSTRRRRGAALAARLWTSWQIVLTSWSRSSFCRAAPHGTRRNHREAPSLLVHHPVSWRTADGVSSEEGPQCWAHLILLPDMTLANIYLYDSVHVPSTAPMH